MQPKAHIHWLLMGALTTAIAAAAFADTLTLNTTNPTGGGEYGDSVALIGDINGDGYPDAMVGAPDEDIVGTTEAGRVYIYSGKTGALIRTHTSPSPEVVGWYGEVCLGLGDINGDGRADYAIAAPNQGAGVEGDLYVYSGLSGAQIYHLNGWYYRTFGELALVPDCTGDGFPELAIGYSGSGNYANVRVYQAKNGVLWKTLTSPIPMGDPSSFGVAVAGIPDVTGDGKGDVAVGAPGAEPGSAPSGAGRVYVFNGATGALYDTIISHDEQTLGRFGSAVAGIIDVSGDGKGDIVIGADNEKADGSATNAGQVHVHSGATGNWIRTLNSTDPTSNGDFGAAIAISGDLTEDGKQDIHVGAAFETVSGTESGRVYAFSGATGTLIWTRNAPGSTAERFGDSLDASQDINQDGLPDLIVGAPSTDVGSDAAAGRAFMYRTLKNDGCENISAPPIPVTNGTWDFTTVGAGTTGPAEPECLSSNDDQVNSDVFYSYVATCSGTLTVSTCDDADFDTRIAIYQGCGYTFNGFFFPCNLNTILACNDDYSGCAGFTSFVQVPVTEGNCYRFRIGGFETAQGSGVFHVSCAQSCLGDINGDGKVDAADLAVLLGQWGQNGSADLNNDNIVNGADLASMLGAWGNC
ncbi:MAG: FG-GAP-like repeat-containing protein [Phycisphaerae bacterium]|nr:FG-GAP-like repeat-containing protein [Phycisphaerae bacterium]